MRAGCRLFRVSLRHTLFRYSKHVGRHDIQRYRKPKQLRNVAHVDVSEMVGLICEFRAHQLHFSDSFTHPQSKSLFITYSTNVISFHLVSPRRNRYSSLIAELFERRKVYNTYCFQSRHPELNAYIKGVVDACGEEIARVSNHWRFADCLTM